MRTTLGFASGLQTPGRNGSRHRPLLLSILLGLVCIAGTLCSVVIHAGVAEAAPSTWSIISSPNQGSGNNELSSAPQGPAVSCTSPTSCVAVGSYTNSSGVNQTLIQSWDGTAWTIASSPDQGNNDNELGGVSCTNPTDCMAVGYYTNSSGVNQTLIESWDGTAWTISSSPDQGSDINGLDGVSCISSTSCVAVGSYFDDGSESGQTLIESWDGTAWTITPSPDQGSNEPGLSGVSCTSSTSCVAVGNYTSSGVSQTLIESWDGTAWTITSSPNERGVSNGLDGVSCTSSTSCVAVGNYQGPTSQTLVETWNGTSWGIAPSPNQGSDPTYLDNVLFGVSCTSSTSCTAVGYYTNGTGVSQTLVESLDGTAWSITSSPNEGGDGDQLGGVSCTGPINCTAVGYYTNGTGVTQTLVESGSTPPPTITSFAPASGPASTVVAITGTYLSGATQVSFNGVRSFAVSKDTATKIWAQVPTHATTGEVSVTTDGGTVESATDFTVTQTPPSPWSVTPSPNQGSIGSNLNGVSCTSSTSCVAVGDYDGANGVRQTLVETWNGTRWSISASPNPSSTYSSLSGVSCTSSTNCVAVGSYLLASGSGQTLIETLKGTTWSVASSSGPSSTSNGLNGVSCTSSTSCVAVGDYDDTSGIQQTLVETWNGTTWSITASFNEGFEDNMMDNDLSQRVLHQPVGLCGSGRLLQLNVGTEPDPDRSIISLGGRSQPERRLQPTQRCVLLWHHELCGSWLRPARRGLGRVQDQQPMGDHTQPQSRSGHQPRAIQRRVVYSSDELRGSGRRPEWGPRRDVERLRLVDHPQSISGQQRRQPQRCVLHRLGGLRGSGQLDERDSGRSCYSSDDHRHYPICRTSRCHGDHQRRQPGWCDTVDFSWHSGDHHHQRYSDQDPGARSSWCHHRQGLCDNSRRISQ